MSKGRKRTPTNLKILKGTDRPERRAENEPDPELGIPDPPDFVKEREDVLVQYNYLASTLDKMRVLAESDVHALAMMADSLARYISCIDYLDENGSVYETRNQHGEIMYRARPEAGMATTAFDRFCRLASSFGLTPADRSKVEQVARGKKSKGQQWKEKYA